MVLSFLLGLLYALFKSYAMIREPKGKKVRGYKEPFCFLRLKRL